MFVLPPIQEIERIVSEELPSGHELVSVELVNDAGLTEGTAPFALVVNVIEHPDADLAIGVGYDIAERIRKRWAAEDVQIRITSVTKAESD